MDANAQYELYLIKEELRKIINELSAVSTGVRYNFSGIGNDRCANTIDLVIEQYKTVSKKLAKIDTTKVTEEFLAAQGGR